MKKKILTISALVLAVGAIWFGWSAYLASRKLVSLDVRDMPVRQVCRIIERQTWETIYVAKPVDGKVTLRVKNTPLDEVLGIVAEQVNARSTAVYPLYSSKASLKKLERIALGEDTEPTGWKAWRTRPFGGGMFGQALRDENKLVTLQLVNKDVEFASLALNRFGRVQVVPEDDTTRKVALLLHNASMPEAVGTLAKAADRKWTLFYTLQPGFGFGFGPRGPRNLDTNAVASAEGGTNQPPFPFFGMRRRGGTNDPSDTNGPPAEWRAEMEKQREAQLATMTPAEQQKFEEDRQRFEAIREQMAEMRNLPADQREQRMQELMSTPEMQAMMQNRMENMQNRFANSLKNTTPEQRVDRTRVRLERMQRFNANPPPGR